MPSLMIRLYVDTISISVCNGQQPNPTQLPIYQTVGHFTLKSTLYIFHLHVVLFMHLECFGTSC